MEQREIPILIVPYDPYDPGSAVLAELTEGSETVLQTLRLMRSVLLGAASGLESGAPTFRDAANTKNRVATTYASGTRTITSTDGT
jgi:hypothetical protein